MTPAIELRNITKAFPDGTKALDNITLEFPQARTTSIVGPSGSGKSTMLKIIAGLWEPTDGAVLFKGQDITSVPPERRNIGIVFQSYALFPNMTVLGNVEFGLLVRGVSKSERIRRAQQALEMVQIAGLGHRKIRQLSGGQQQRVAVARALVFNPDILLLDEPLSSLDAKLREELRAELSRLLHQLKITAVYVTHDQAEAMALGDQVVVLNSGHVMQVGSSFEIYRRPQNAFVANFIGTANFFAGSMVPLGTGNMKIQLSFADIEIPTTVVTDRWPGWQSGPFRLLFRPQDIDLSGPENAHCYVKVTDVLFLGDRLRIGAETNAGDRILLETPSGATQIRVGDSIPIRIKIENIHLLPPED